MLREIDERGALFDFNHPLAGQPVRFEVKIFGGGKVLPGLGDIGLGNVKFVREFLAMERLPISSEYVLGHYARRLRYHPLTGKAMVKRLPITEVLALNKNERLLRKHLADQVNALCDPDFFVPVGETGGGMANAIVGSLKLLLLAAVIGLPVGLMAGVYLATGFINLWAAVTIRQQGTLVYLLALGVLLAGIGRLVSISQVGLPEPAAVWLGYLIPELLLPVVIAAAHRTTHRSAARTVAA